MAANNYTAGYPALAPLQSNQPDSPAAGINAGTQLNDDHIRAARRQTERRRVLCNRNPPLASEQELQDAIKREFQVVAENSTGGAWQPAWAAQFLQHQNNILQLQIHTHQQQNVMQHMLVTLDNRTHDLQAQTSNGATYLAADRIVARRNAAGILPGQHFPTTRHEIDGLTGPQIDVWLQFYGLPNPAFENRASRLHRLKLFLGLRW